MPCNALGRGYYWNKGPPSSHAKPYSDKGHGLRHYYPTQNVLPLEGVLLL
jgi:hypothetical protein